jgi:hypothetical protein
VHLSPPFIIDSTKIQITYTSFNTRSEALTLAGSLKVSCKLTEAAVEVKASIKTQSSKYVPKPEPTPLSINQYCLEQNRIFRSKEFILFDRVTVSFFVGAINIPSIPFIQYAYCKSDIRPPRAMMPPPKDANIRPHPPIHAMQRFKQISKEKCRCPLHPKSAPSS